LWAAYENDAAAAAGCYVSASLSTKTLKGTWASASLRAKTLREIKENVGQSLRKETLKNRKDDFRSKVLKNREKEQSKRSKKATRLLCVSTCPPHLAPTLCMSVFYHLSFLRLQSPPVRSVGAELMRKLARIREQRLIWGHSSRGFIPSW
jgi:hypothetical protein